MVYTARSYIWPALGEVVTETDPSRLVRELHATAVAIGQAKARQDVTGVQNLLVHFRAVAEAYRNTGAGDMSLFDSLILQTGQWVQQALAAVPGAVSALPMAILKGLALPALLAAGLWYVVSGKAGRGRRDF